MGMYFAHWIMKFLLGSELCRSMQFYFSIPQIHVDLFYKSNEVRFLFFMRNRMHSYSVVLVASTEKHDHVGFHLFTGVNVVLQNHAMQISRNIRNVTNRHIRLICRTWHLFFLRMQWSMIAKKNKHKRCQLFCRCKKTIIWNCAVSKYFEAIIFARQELLDLGLAWHKQLNKTLAHLCRLEIQQMISD